MTRWAIMALAGALAVPALAAAQDNDRTVVIVDDEETGTRTDRRSLEEDRDRGVKVQGLFGLENYTGDAGDLTNAGPAYGVAITAKPTNIIGGELAYKGSTFNTASDLAGGENRIVENGGQAVIKASPRLGAVEPYAFGGIGLNHISAPDESLFVQDDTFFQVPLGVGVDFHVPVGGGGTDLVIGARGTYDLGLGQDAFAGVDNANNLRFVLGAGAQF